MKEDWNFLLKYKQPIILKDNPSISFRIAKYFEETLDVFLFESEELNIAQAREIKKNIFLKSKEGKERLIIIGVSKILLEASQAMLKILEEPPLGVRMLIVFPNPRTLSSSVISRVVVLESVSQKSIQQQSEEFLNKNVLERIKMFESIEDNFGFQIFEDIEFFVKENKLVTESSWRNAVLDIYKSKKALSLLGASKKQIWEYLSFSIPKLK